MKFRKRPLEVEAIQLTKENRDEFLEWLETHKCPSTWYVAQQELGIYTLEGTLTVSDGDWVIKGIKGEFYPCKPDVFEETYDKIEE